MFINEKFYKKIVIHTIKNLANVIQKFLIL